MANQGAAKLHAVVIDANVAIAVCANEPDKYANAVAKIEEYAISGSIFYAPGVIVSECLYVFCRKQADGVLTAKEYSDSIASFADFMAAVNPPPLGDKSLVKRAEEIRGGLGCSRSADAIYLALAEALSVNGSADIMTFDQGMTIQAANCGIPATVTLLPVI